MTQLDLFKKTECTEYYAKVKDILTKFTAKPKLSNITKERKALHNLRKDDSHMVLTADKGFALVIIDKDIYIGKCMALLNDELVHCDQTKSIHSKVLNF